MTSKQGSTSEGHGAAPTEANRTMRIVCVAADAPAASALQEIVATILPGAHVWNADLASIRGAPDGDCAVVAAGAHPASARVLVHELRGRGFEGAIVVVLESLRSLDPEDRRVFARFGVETMGRLSLPHELPEALERALRRDAGFARSPEGSAMLETLRRTRELIAAGEVASSLMHRLNNPLAALLAEAQLLGLESLELEHASSVERIVALTRRIIELTNSIEDPSRGGRV